jgi:hypothetical protein
MTDAALKRQLFENYLKQQKEQAGTTSARVPEAKLQSENENTLVLYENPENISMDEFKTYVKKWFEYDNFIKKAREVVREKRKARDKLTEVITEVMCRHNIEDLNTKEGRIRCKTQVVKAPVNQKVVKERITDYFKNNEHQRDDILHKIYEEREKVEKVSLRRLKIN